MKQIFFILLAFLSVSVRAQLSLDACQSMARANYPLIKQYDLIGMTAEYNVSNVQKAWLPQISASAQATYQNAVTQLPSQLSNIIEQMGGKVEGLKKDQYRVGLSVNQLIWDGGRLKAQKEVVKAQAVAAAQDNDVSLYALRERINDLYFGILLLDEKLALNQTLQSTLSANETHLQKLVKGGVAMQCDTDLMTAERLSAVQQQKEIESMQRSYRTMLSLFIGSEEALTATLQKPKKILISSDAGNRPEMKKFDAQLTTIDAQEKLLDKNLLPRLEAFATGYYGYPGYDMFHDMYHHTWSLNGQIGARLSWNINSLYTRKNDKAKLQLQRESIENAREVFLFNNRLQSSQQTENIRRYRTLMEEDSRIIELRGNVRKAYESKLRNGIVDATSLVREINNENAARIQKSVHEIEMLKQMYELKNTTNQ